jgi:GST-like protein
MESISYESRMRVQDPSKIQLYSAFTPNGIKVSAALEEIKELRKLKEDFDFEPHVVDIRHGESRSTNFRSLNPNGKIPLIIDATGEEEIILSESGAILVYLAEKFDLLLPKTGSERYVTLQWLFWSSSAFSVQTKLFGFYYKYCRKNIPYCLERYSAEVLQCI